MTDMTRRYNSGIGGGSGISGRSSSSSSNSLEHPLRRDIFSLFNALYACSLLCGTHLFCLFFLLEDIFDIDRQKVRFLGFDLCRGPRRMPMYLIMGRFEPIQKF